MRLLVMHTDRCEFIFLHGLRIKCLVIIISYILYVFTRRYYNHMTYNMKLYSYSYRALCLAVVGMVVVVIAACLSGLVMYANYAECDPLSMGYIGKSDQVYCFLKDVNSPPPFF